MDGSKECLVGESEGKILLGRRMVYGRIILKWILQKSCGKVWNGCSWLRIGASNTHI
jgi:hypothetical protein